MESDEDLVDDVFTGSVAYRHYLGDLLIIHWLERMLTKDGKYRVYKSAKTILDFFLCHDEIIRLRKVAQPGFEPGLY